ncbi:MAG: hypothetical protein ACLRTD_27895 [Bacteroides sp.]
MRKHLNYEDETVFPYIRALINGGHCGNIKLICWQAARQVSKACELKNILIKYYPANSSNDLNSVLFDIFLPNKTCHIIIEDNLLVPMITEWKIS